MFLHDRRLTGFVLALFACLLPSKNCLGQSLRDGYLDRDSNALTTKPIRLLDDYPSAMGNGTSSQTEGTVSRILDDPSLRTASLRDPLTDSYLVRRPEDQDFDDRGTDSPRPNYTRFQSTPGGAGSPRSRPFAVDGVYFGRSGISSSPTSLQMSQVGFNFTGRIPMGDRLTFTFRPLADIMFLSGPGGSVSVLPEQLYKIAFDCQFDTQINDLFGLSVGVTPGFWTDFIKFNGDAFRIPARVLLTYRPSETFFLAAGILYTDNINQNLYPGGGIIWNASDRWRFEILFPRSRVVYRINEDWQVYGVVEGYGGTYSIRSNVGGTLYNELTQYHDVRVMIGAQTEYFRFMSMFVELGGAFDRKFRFNSGGSPQPNFTVNDAFVIRVGLRF